MQIALILLVLLLWGSSIVWWSLLARLWKKQPLLDQVEGPSPRWRTFPELTAVLIVLACSGLTLFTLLLGRRLNQPITPSQLALQIEIPLGLTLFLFMTLSLSDSRLSDYGMTLKNLGRQLTLGFQGYLSIILPMSLSMAATSFVRSPESEHALLKLLDAAPNPFTIGAVMVAAIVAAPLWEELQFRVILQGWISTICPPSIAIGFVAVLFAMVHGWRDGLALLPLALILGYVYQRQRSYLAVVVIHALFNATMLVLQVLIPHGAS